MLALRVLRDGRGRACAMVIMVECARACGADTAVEGCNFATLDVCPARGMSIIIPSQNDVDSYLMPQSSHSSTGFHPSLFMQISHLAPSRVLLNKKSSGFHTAASCALKRVGDVVPLRGSTPLTLVRRPPGLMSVKRCTSGTMELERCTIVEPSVAAATEISDSERLPFACSNADIEPAVWYESIVISESVGVGPCTPVARGRDMRSSEPFGF